MRTRIAAAVLGVALVGVPTAAQAKNKEGAPGYSEAVNSALNDGNYKPYEERYLRLYNRYSDEFGVREAGRNIVLFGLNADDGVKDAPASEVIGDADTMEAALNPAPVAAVPTTTESTGTTTTTTTSSAASGTVACESGGDYSANTGNGYYGGYQFDSGTWDAYGDPAYAEASDAPPAAQDAAAASVPYDAWPSC